MIESGIQPSYILDEMTLYEMKILLNNLEKKNKDSWEQTRFMSYIVAQCHSTKSMKMDDIMKFPWDDEKEEKEDTSITNRDIERLRNKAKNYLKEKEKNNG